MSYTFTEATPVTRHNPGRSPEPNPFIEVVASIALKTNDDGSSVARAFVAKHDADPEIAKPELLKLKRQLSKAGHATDPKVSVYSDIDPKSPTESVITFWTKPYSPRGPKSTKES